MTFLHPEFLYYMLPVVLILFYFVLTQKDPVFALFDDAVLERLRVNTKNLTMRQRNLIYSVIFILLIVAMAQPVLVEGKVKVRSLDRDVMVALDISASMHTRDVYPDRLTFARQKILLLMEEANRERIGLMAFGKDAFLVAPPSRDLRAEKFLLRQLSPASLSEPGTDLLTLLAAADQLMERLPEKNLLMVTDGGDETDLSEAAAYARAHRLRLFIMGVGTEAGGVIETAKGPLYQGGVPVVSRLNPGLASLAEATGGAYLQTTTAPGDVTEMLAMLRARSAVHPGQKEEIERYGQLFVLPLGLALFLLLVATSSLGRREEVRVPTLLLFGILLFGLSPQSRAEPFDYELLKDAKRSYDRGEYGRAANFYYRYGKRNGNDVRALYNSAHALYRQGHYKTAAALWGEIRSKDLTVQFRTLHNLGNALAMLGSEADLKAAIQAYKGALMLHNDRLTRENLERVRGRLIRMMRQKRQQQELAQSGQSQQSGSRSSEQGKENRSPGQTGAPQQPVSQNVTLQSMPGVFGQREQPRPSGMQKQDAAEKKAGVKTAAAQSGEEANLSMMGALEAAKWYRRLEKAREGHLYKITPLQTPRRSEDDANPW